MPGGSALVARPVHAEHRALRVLQHRDPGPSGTEVGSMSTVPPPSVVSTATVFTSATAKYGSQCAGTSCGNLSSIVTMPPKSAPSIPHCG